MASRLFLITPYCFLKQKIYICISKQTREETTMPQPKDTRQFRIDDDEYATFMILSRQRDSNGNVEMRKMIKDFNDANLKGRKRRYTMADWEAIKGKK